MFCAFEGHHLHYTYTRHLRVCERECTEDYPGKPLPWMTQWRRYLPFNLTNYESTQQCEIHEATFEGKCERKARVAAITSLLVHGYELLSAERRLRAVTLLIRYFWEYLTKNDPVTVGRSAVLMRIGGIGNSPCRGGIINTSVHTPAPMMQVEIGDVQEQNERRELRVKKRVEKRVELKLGESELIHMHKMRAHNDHPSVIVSTLYIAHFI
ncbi:hypothetical protein CAPTEDRAFT_207555 [Capitella teleta]|uniref:Uncharacterized protein n=1 Tax=Capitella teleta TaxID=283909 RepID=R7VGM5_CAPTE|nr:hypothetical protein CAPTEDRAFT_207555 [Capitella teleta]|eukprot:ELU14845.1 hypothetical protein CAPTEDRAFT_207555 [Capitella teleta]